MAVNFSQIKVNKEGFATIKTPVSSAGMMRHALDVEATFNDILNGTGRKATINRLLFTTASAKTVSGGIVSTPTLAQHTITSETGTADDVDTIGASNNTFLFVRATTGHVITLKNNTGNITVPGGSSLILSGNITAILWCEDGQWSVIGTTLARANPSGTTDPGSGEDALDGYSVGSIWVNTSKKRAWICVDNTAAAAIWKLVTPWRDSFRFRASAATVLGIGVAAPTVTGDTLSAGNNSINTYMRSEASGTGIIRGVISASFNLIRGDHDPIVEITLIPNWLSGSKRYWVGLTTAAATNSDTAADKFIGFRHSYAVDTGWRPVLRDGTTQGTGTDVGTLAATDYRLRIRVDSANSRAFFSVNDGAEQIVSTGFPAATTEFGVVCQAGFQGAGNTDLYFSNAEVGW